MTLDRQNSVLKFRRHIRADFKGFHPALCGISEHDLKIHISQQEAEYEPSCQTTLPAIFSPP